MSKQCFAGIEVPTVEPIGGQNRLNQRLVWQVLLSCSHTRPAGNILEGTTTAVIEV
jgi:hypothetical protein